MLQLIRTEIVGFRGQEFDLEHQPSILCLLLPTAKIARRRAIIRPPKTLTLGHDDGHALCTSHINNVRD